MGIQNGNNPKQDFENLKHGKLALKLMLYFVEKNPKQYVQTVLKNSCKECCYACPFIASSLEVVKLMCDTICLENDEHSKAFKSNQNYVFTKIAFENSFENFLEVGTTKLENNSFPIFLIIL